MKIPLALALAVFAGTLAAIGLLILFCRASMELGWRRILGWVLAVVALVIWLTQPP